MEKQRFTIEIPVDDLAENLMKLIRPELETFIGGTMTKQKDELQELLTRDQVCKMLKISSTTLWRMQKENSLCFKKIGKKILFEKSAVEDFLKRNN